MSGPHPDGAAFTGAALAVRNGAVLAERCHGLADRDAGTAWDVGTRTQIASISKRFATAVAEILVARGVLSFDDAVAGVLPEAPAAWRRVTVGHLVTHTSGLPHWGSAPAFDPAVPMDPAERVRDVLAAPLESEPGTSYRYSSPGYAVLAAVLAAAAGRDYRTLVQDEVIGPLRLARTTIGDERGRGDARGYRHGEPAPAWPLHSIPGTGDVWSTAADLAAFVTAVNTGALPAVGSAAGNILTVRLPSRTRPGAPVVANEYRCGHFAGTVAGRPALIYAGDNPGYLALAAWLPDAGAALVALTNDDGDGGDLDPVLAGLAAAVPPR